MKISISTRSYSAYPPLVLPLEPDTSDMRQATKRVTRRATLDSGCVITNTGYSDSDRTLNVRANVTKAQGDQAWEMFQQYSLLTFAVNDGVFVGAIETMNIQNGKLDMTVLVKEKL